MLPPPTTVTSNAGQQRRGTMLPISSLQAKMTVAPHMLPGKEPVQFKEGKRFIPLIDTDDEEDEVEDEIVG
ncbi:hypothetical protein H1R20_g2736, partial [Candolleomyces eurysporus]